MTPGTAAKARLAVWSSSSRSRGFQEGERSSCAEHSDSNRWSGAGSLALNRPLARSQTVSDMVQKVAGDWTQPMVVLMGMAMSGSSSSYTGGRMASERHAWGLSCMRQKPVVNVLFVLKRGAAPWVSVSSQGHRAVQCPAELHGLGRGMRHRCGVDGAPRVGPGVVTEETGAAEQFFLDGRGRGLQVGQVSDDDGRAARRRTGCRCNRPVARG